MESIPIVPQPINVPATSKESAVDKGNSPCAASHQGTTMEVTKTSITEASLPMTPVTNCSITETSNKILDIILDYALSKFNGTKDRLEAGRPKFLSVLDKFVSAGTRVEMCLPAFPFKSANKVYKVFGILPDKAEEIALDRLNTMCMRIGEVYQPGAKYTIISDGLVYNDLLCISDRDTWAYGEALRAMAVKKGFTHIGFSRIQDFVNLPLPEKLDEITYVANATNFRRFMINNFGKEDLNIEDEIANSPDTKMTYLGYRRFLESDLRHIFPLGVGRSSTGYKKDVRYLAKQMLIRGYAFAGAVKYAFPDHLRLSIHQSTGDHKISISLLNTKTGFTTPWHCSVALMADGQWLSAPMGDFHKDPRFKIVYENGCPSHFQEIADDVIDGKTPTEQPTAVSEKQSRRQRKREISTPVLPFVNGVEEEKIAALARTLSAHSIKDENGEPTNPSFGSKNHLLDPNSGKFGVEAWLQMVMRINSRSPERNSKGVAGVAYKNLSAHGFAGAADYLTFGNYPLKLLSLVMRLFRKEKKTEIRILRNFEGLVKSGEMLVVLGRPRSGCSTFLKAISGENDGIHVGEDSYLNYQGIPKEKMHKDFRGECIYQSVVNVHFPHLTVSQTLDFAARARAPHNLMPGVNRDMYVEHLRDAAMAVFGLSHIVNKKVGNDSVSGVSDGERKRVRIAEAAIAGSSLQCWDNSTSGIDNATALEFVQTLRTSTKLTGAMALVTVGQVSQSIYGIFDKVTVLYEGRQIYFGNIHAAKKFFFDLGFDCRPRQTIADFLTSLTCPAERRVRQGFESKTPSTPDEFAAVWQKSDDRARLLQEIEEFDNQYPMGGSSLDEFKNSLETVQGKSQHLRLPCTLSVPQQVALCVRRGYQRQRKDIVVVISGPIFNSIMALVIGSVDPDLIYSRGALLFFAALLLALASVLEILTLYVQRSIVDKHFKSAFYHPFAEGIASMVCDLPNKILTTLGSGLTIYFVTQLQRTTDHFVMFLLFSLTCILTLSLYVRCTAALSRTLPHALAPASIVSLALFIYTGFTIPIKDMHPWFQWLSFPNPVGNAFEGLTINDAKA